MEAPTINQAFNPLCLGALIASPDRLRSIFPDIIPQLVTQEVHSNLDREVLKLHDAAKGLWEDGPRMFYAQVYKKWAEDRNVPFQDSEAPSAKAGIGHEQPTEFVRCFEEDLLKGKITRRQIVSAFKGMVGAINLPALRFISGEVASTLYSELKKVPYQIVLKLLPDLKDTEAQEIFGKLTDAEDVRRLSARAEI